MPVSAHHPMASLPVNPTKLQSQPSSAAQTPVIQTQYFDSEPPMSSSCCSRMKEQSCTYVCTAASVVLASLCSVMLLIVSAMAASHCTSDEISSIQAADPKGLILVTQSVCALELSTRYWLLVSLGLNTCLCCIILPKISTYECCHLSLSMSGWKKYVTTFISVGYLVSTCLLIGLMYTQHDSAYDDQLPVLHLNAAVLLFGTGSVAIALATTFFLNSEILTSISEKVSRRRSDADVENAMQQQSSRKLTNLSTSATSIQPQSRSSGNIKLRGRFQASYSNNAANVMPAAVTQITTNNKQFPSGAIHVSSLRANTNAPTGGMSLTEIKQIATQIIPCCTPSMIRDATSGEMILLPCCARAPVLPSIPQPLGFTSPRNNDQGPVADFTDAAKEITLANLTSPQVLFPPVAPIAEESPSHAHVPLAVPRHLYLNTNRDDSPSHLANPVLHLKGVQGICDSPDVLHLNSPPALHAEKGSALESVLLHGPMSADASCELCMDLFTTHQLIKILPNCHHAFHSSCVVPYLNFKRICPVCKVEILTNEDNQHALLSQKHMRSLRDDPHSLSRSISSRASSSSSSMHVSSLNSTFSLSQGIAVAPTSGGNNNHGMITAAATSGKQQQQQNEKEFFEASLKTTTFDPHQALRELNKEISPQNGNNNMLDQEVMLQQISPERHQGSLGMGMSEISLTPLHQRSPKGFLHNNNNLHNPSSSAMEHKQQLRMSQRMMKDSAIPMSLTLDMGEFKQM